ncbi:MAG: nucleotidyl transferase AbiEii/AbiGii toxin family protein [Leptolinea sp.]
MDSQFYLDKLYPFQNQVLNVVKDTDTLFYLTGGTALSRGYLNHRFSDDLDFFVNDDDRFGLWTDRIINQLTLSSSPWNAQVIQREDRFSRLSLVQNDIDLKIDFINDVPSRIGVVAQHPILGLLDTAQNILANKVTAVLDREAPKDLADIWALCYRMNLSLEDALNRAQGKAAGVFPVDLARVLCSATRSDWELVRWIEAPDIEMYLNQINILGNGLIFPK